MDEKILEFFSFLSKLEQSAQVRRKVLTDYYDYNPEKIFRLLDTENKGYINSNNIFSFLDKFNISYSDETVKLLIIFYDSDFDGNLSFQEFIPLIQNNNAINSKIVNGNLKDNNDVSFNIIYCLTKIFEKEIELNQYILKIIIQINENISYSLLEIFNKLSLNKQFITSYDIIDYLDNKNIDYSDSQINDIMKRLDINKDGKIDFNEFKYLFGFFNTGINKKMNNNSYSISRPFNIYDYNYYNNNNYNNLNGYGNDIFNEKINDNANHLYDQYSSNNIYNSIENERKYNYIIEREENKIPLSEENDYKNNFCYTTPCCDCRLNENLLSKINIGKNEDNYSFNSFKNKKFRYNDDFQYNFKNINVNNDFQNNNNIEYYNDNTNNKDNLLNNDFNELNDYECANEKDIFKNNIINDNYDINNYKKNFPYLINNSNNEIKFELEPKYNNPPNTKRFQCNNLFLRDSPKRKFLLNKKLPQSTLNMNTFYSVPNNYECINTEEINQSNYEGKIFNGSYVYNNYNNYNQNFTDNSNLNYNLNFKYKPLKRANSQGNFIVNRNNILQNNIIYNNTDNDILAEDKKILSNYFKILMEGESQIELKKLNLISRKDFNCLNVFNHFDDDNKGYITFDDLKNELEFIGLILNNIEIQLLLNRFNHKNQKKNIIDYDSFCNGIYPYNLKYEDSSNEKMQNADKNKSKTFSPTTKLYFKALIKAMADSENKLNEFKKKYINKNNKIVEVLKDIDLYGKGYLDIKELINFLRENDIYTSLKDAQILFLRLDENNQNKIYYNDILSDLNFILG